MKFSVKNTSGENIVNLMRMINYHYQGTDKEKSEMSFVRPVSGTAYPRFHIYLKEDKTTELVVFRLHLDQKRPVYKRVAAHSGEYKGQVVEKEAERIKKFLSEEMEK